MARLPYVEVADAPEKVREVLENLPVQLNVFRMMAQAESCFRPLLGLGAAILTQQSLDARLRELAILRVAQRSRAPYEWTQHVPIARAAGARAEQVEALERGDPGAPCFDAAERCVLRFTDELLDGARVSDELFAETRRSFSPREIVELIVAVGYYMMIARLLETTGVDLDRPAGTAVVDAARSGEAG